MGNNSHDAGLSVYRDEFPVLQKLVHGKSMHYLDSANSSQKPNSVIDAMSAFMRESYSPVGVTSVSGASNSIRSTMVRVKFPVKPKLPV